MADLPTICQPCPEQPEIQLVSELPSSMCPCPEPAPDDNSAILPTITTITVTDDCFQSMLYNMTSVKFCNIGPKAC